MVCEGELSISISLQERFIVWSWSLNHWPCKCYQCHVDTVTSNRQVPLKHIHAFLQNNSTDRSAKINSSENCWFYSVSISDAQFFSYCTDTDRQIMPPSAYLTMWSHCDLDLLTKLPQTVCMTWCSQTDSVDGWEKCRPKCLFFDYTCSRCNLWPSDLKI